MQAIVCPRATADLWSLRPTVGALMILCEENYLRLSRLVPGLSTRRGRLVSRVTGGVDLHLIIETQAPYTTELRLTHVFSGGEGVGTDLGCDPNLRLRVYHDARQVDVLDLRQTVLPLRADYQAPALDSKWRTHLFVAKWLAYCLQQGHGFGGTCPAHAPRAEDDDLAYSCG
ncbi:MAG: DUF1249 domain-containing protein [Bdellovibrio bacteriovorus]